MAFNLDLFQKLFEPESIAIIGASNVPGKWGFILPVNLVIGGYKGRLHYVNPKESYIQGYKAFHSIEALPEPVDLMVVTVPASLVPKVMEDAAKKGVKTVLVISSGFSETGKEGKKLEEQVVKIATDAGILMVGPNTMGICSPPAHLFSMGAFVQPPPGNIAFLSQSGNLGVQILGWAERGGLGISRFLNSGNEGQVTCDLALEYFGKDPMTKVVVLYLEGIDYGEHFFEVAYKVGRTKPVIALKVGVTEAGMKAAASHSGAVATSYRVYEAMAKQAGIIQANNTEELVDLARCFGNLPLPKGKRVGIMTLGGGWGVVTTDLCAKEGLELPPLSPATMERIDQILPSFWSHGNPVDMVGTVQRKTHFDISEALSQDPNFDIIITLGSLLGVKIGRTDFMERLGKAFDKIVVRYKWRTPRFFWNIIAKGYLELRKNAKKPQTVGKSEKSGGINLEEARSWGDDIYARHIHKLMEKTGKPIVPVAFDPSAITEILLKFQLASFAVPEKAVMAVKKMADYHNFLARRKEAEDVEFLELASEDITRAAEYYIKDLSGPLSENESKRLLQIYGISTPREKLVASEDGAVAAAKEIGFPVVLKIDSPDILHKTEAKGVKVGIASEAEARSAYKEILENAKSYKPDARINGMLVAEMVQGGVEVMVGISRDPTFGPVLVLGLGGIFVEALEDVTMRLLPIHRIDAYQMIEELRGKRLLKGFRGRPPADIDQLVEVILRVGRLAYDLRGRVMEMDLNPVIVLPKDKGVRALDALVVLNKKEP
jgi:acetyltransferase